MLDVSDVVAFETRLKLPVEVIEEPWRDEWSERVADEWRSRVAVDTGEYRDSIEVTDEGAASDAPQSMFNEYGTAHMAPQPALVPAINALARRAAEDAGLRTIRQLT